MQRVSVGLFKKPVKTLSAKTGQKVTGNKVLDFPTQYAAGNLDLVTVAAAA